MKQIFAILIAFSALPAFAGWKKMGESDGIRIYSDPSTYKALSSERRRAWLLVDLDQIDQFGAKSYRLFVESSCSENKYRFLNQTLFRSPMAAGQPLFSEDKTSEWMHAAPGTIGQGFLKILCK